MTRRWTIAEVNTLDRDAFVSVFGGVFEHSPWVAEAAWDMRPFASSVALLGAMLLAVREAPWERVMALIKAHPDLGGRIKMSEASVREQQGAGLERLTPEEYEELSALNRAYMQRFGFPFILAVRGKTKDDIISGMRARIGRTAEAERAEALHQIGRIAAFRLADLFGEDSGWFAEAAEGAAEADEDGDRSEDVMTGTAGFRGGRLTTHVLDTMQGRPAAGMRIELYRLGGSEPVCRERLREAVTNADGRTDEPLLAGGKLQAGVYELVFHAGDYFAAAEADIGFLDEVPVRFRIVDPSAHYHVPLLVSPGGYSTYRGS